MMNQRKKNSKTNSIINPLQYCQLPMMDWSATTQVNPFNFYLFAKSSN